MHLIELLVKTVHSQNLEFTYLEK